MITMVDRRTWVAKEHLNVYCDSQNNIHLTKNQIYHARTKHMNGRFQFVQKVIKNKKIFLPKIGTIDNPTYMFTNLVTSMKFKYCLSLINIQQD